MSTLSKSRSESESSHSTSQLKSGKQEESSSVSAKESGTKHKAHKKGHKTTNKLEASADKSRASRSAVSESKSKSKAKGMEYDASDSATVCDRQGIGGDNDAAKVKDHAKEDEEEKEEEVDVSMFPDILTLDPKELSDEDRNQQSMYSTIVHHSESFVFNSWNAFRSVRRLVESYGKSPDHSPDALVLVKPSINKIHNISSADGTIDIELGLQFWWLQPSCKGYEGNPSDWRDALKDKIWTPIVEFSGDVDLAPQIELEEKGSWYIRDIYARYGVINWYQKWKGSISFPMDLHNFPFDRQVVKIRFGCPLWGDEDIHLENILSEEELHFFNEAVDLDEWDIVSKAKIEPKVVWSREDQRNISYLELSFHIKRKSGYYISHVVALVFLIMFMGWGIYFVTPETLNDRIALGVTLFLSLVALNFVVNEVIPKVSYWTWLGQYFFICYASTVFTVPQSVVSFLINRYYCGVLLGDAACNFAITFDWICWAIVAFTQLIYTMVFIIKAKRMHAGEVVIEQKSDVDLAAPPADSHIKVD